jgi:hypothetical protein
MRQPKLSSLDRWHCLAAWGDRAKVPEEAGFGPNPTLPEPTETISASEGLAARRELRALGRPFGPSLRGRPRPSALALRSSNGDVLVTETNAPPRPGCTALYGKMFACGDTQIPEPYSPAFVLRPSIVTYIHLRRWDHGQHHR